MERKQRLQPRGAQILAPFARQVVTTNVLTWICEWRLAKIGLWILWAKSFSSSSKFTEGVWSQALVNMRWKPTFICIMCVIACLLHRCVRARINRPHTLIASVLFFSLNISLCFDATWQVTLRNCTIGHFLLWWWCDRLYAGSDNCGFLSAEFYNFGTA